MSFGEGGEDDDDGGGRKKVKMSRPFGVSLLIAGCDARGPQLYHTDPSGTYVAWDAQAIGSGSEAARTLLRERYAKSMGLAAAAALIVRVLAETMEEKVIFFGVAHLCAAACFCTLSSLFSVCFCVCVCVCCVCVCVCVAWH